MWREKGLCFNYDEKFTCGHKCASSLFLLVADEDDTLMEPSHSILNLDPPNPTTEPPQAQIILHALSGHIAPKTLWVMGLIANKGVHILLDRGSTHNFL